MRSLETIIFSGPISLPEMPGNNIKVYNNSRVSVKDEGDSFLVLTKAREFVVPKSLCVAVYRGHNEPVGKKEEPTEKKAGGIFGGRKPSG